MTVHERPTGQRSGKGHGDSGKHGGSLGSSLGAKRANGKEILTIGEDTEKDCVYTAETVHRAFSGHFNKHFGEGGEWYRRSTVHPLFCMDQAGKDYREEVLEGAADPSSLPKDLRGSLQALRTKTVDGVLLTPSLYTGIVTDE